MEIKSIFKTMVLAACCLSGVMMTSCKNDDDDKKDLKFSAAKVDVAAGATTTVAVANGTLPLTVKSTDEKTATAKADKNVITITGVKAGKASLLVTDKNKMTGTIAVNVTTPLTFDKAAVTVNVNEEAVVMVKSGKKPYTVKAKDEKTATATVKDDKVTIKGVKKGSTTVTVTDKDKLMGTITVTVK